MSTEPVHRVPRRVVFLMQDVHGAGGLARAVIGLANAFARNGHDVTLLGVTTDRPRVQFPVDPRVQVRWVMPKRERSQQERDEAATEPGRPGKRFVRPADDATAPRWRRRFDERPTGLLDRSLLVEGEPELEPQMSALTDLLLARTLAALPPCVLISTRPVLHRAAARWSPPWVVRIAQDHANYLRRSINPPIIDAIDAAAGRLDAFVNLTTEDAADYTARWARTKRAGARVLTIPNASPFAIGEPAPLRSRVVVTAGRFEEMKGIDRVIDGFAAVAPRHPEWQLHVYGKGDLGPDLRAQVDALGMADRILFPGFAPDFDAVLRGASVFAMGSHTEGLPMVLLEAQAVGLPSVAYDCPRGPADLITDGVSGRLVTNDDEPAYAAALDQVLGDPALRSAMGAAAQRTAEAFTLEVVLDRWEQLFDELTRARYLARPRRTREVRRNPA